MGKNIQQHYAYILLGLIVVFVIVIFVSSSSSPKGGEDYTPLGQIGPYKTQLAECMKVCEYADPANHLAHRAGNCSRYCHSIITDFANKGVTPEEVSKVSARAMEYLRSHNPQHSQYHPEGVCMSMCTKTHNKPYCRLMCYANHQAQKMCNRRCAYSSDERRCTDVCTRSFLDSNPNMTWSATP